MRFTVLSHRTGSPIKQGVFRAITCTAALNLVEMEMPSTALEIQLDPVIAPAAMVMSSVSDVVNALRQRGFRRSASVEEIFNPPVRCGTGLATGATW